MSEHERDISFLAAQIRAGRALLGWSQGELAKRTKTSRSTIADLEAAKREPHEATLFVIMHELAAGGVVLTERGVDVVFWPRADLQLLAPDFKSGV
jgi:transcriptional regulator with XRE-family HTH domain